MTKTFRWTQESVSTLRRLYAEGLPASRIAEQIGCPSRNAVIGKIHRLGIVRPAKVKNPTATIAPGAKRSGPVRVSRNSQKVAAERKSKALIPDTAIHREERRERFQAVADKALERFDAAVPSVRDPVRFLDRGRFQCAMPQPGWEAVPVAQKMVCGQPVQAGTSWCPACLKIVAAPSNFAAFKHRSMLGGIAA